MMDTMSWSFVLFGAIPEAILMLALGLKLLGKDYSIKGLILVGVLQGIAAFYIRRYASFGLHTILLGLTLVVLAIIFLKQQVKTSIFAVALAVIINALVETPYSIFVLWITGWSFGEIITNEWMRVLYVFPKHLIFLLLLFLCLRYGYTLEEEVKKFKVLGD